MSFLTLKDMPHDFFFTEHFKILLRKIELGLWKRTTSSGRLEDKILYRYYKINI